MRIAWLSPAAGNSGIVEYTRQVLPALARYAEPELWSHGRPDHAPQAVPCVDYAAEPEALRSLGRYDAVFYNFGNHLAFHRAEYEASLRSAGVVILHDRTLHHFFAGYYISYLRQPERYVARMTDLYGERGRRVARAVIAQRNEAAWNYEEEVLEHAFVEDALVNAIGAVVHSSSHAREVLARWAGPVCELKMPAYDKHLAVAPNRLPKDGGPITLMSIGHVERNKQILAVIEALATAPDVAERVRYLVIGQYDPRSAYVRDVNRTIADGGLAHIVTLLGYMRPPTLERYAAQADVFVNLRFPNLESGSASLMEQLARGRATLVHDSGAYGELPDGVVVKLPDLDRGELIGVLRQLVADRTLRDRLGAAARSYAETQRMDRYARSLAEFASDADAWRPRLRLADRVGAELRWLGAERRSAARSIGRELGELLG